MTFAHMPEQTERETDFKKPTYTDLIPGVPIKVRILDKEAVHIQTHFITSQKISLRCLGDLCPICAKNRDLFNQNPGKKANELPGFIYKQNRYRTHALNRTQVKISPSGNVIYPVGGKFPPTDPDSGEPIVNVEARPLNRVEILERGPRLFEKFNIVNSTTFNDDGEAIGIWNFDISIVRSGMGTKTDYNVTPHPNLTEPVEVSEEDFFDLEATGIVLEPDEMMKAVAGVSLRDIFAQRRASEENSELEEVVSSASQEVQNKVQDLFEA